MWNLLSHREMYEAVRWHEDPRFRAPMVIYKGEHIFVGGIIEFVILERRFPAGSATGRFSIS